MLQLVASLLTLLLYVTPVLADTHACVDCQQATVAQAISDASTGDTVTIPTDSCTWSSGVVVPDAKRLTFIGAGMSSTAITATGGITMFDLGYSGSAVTEMSLSAPYNAICIRPRGTLWRVRHVMFSCTTSGKKTTGVQPEGGVTSLDLWGVVYQCYFTNAKVVVVGSAQMLDSGTTQHTAWTRALGLGGLDAVYVEGNYFVVTDSIGGNVIDANYAGAYVFRFNNVDGAIVEAHSVQGLNRAARKWEVYNNYLYNSGAAIWYPVFLRGGTGVVFNNKSAGNWTNEGVVFDNVRSHPDYSGTHDGADNATVLSDSGASFSYSDTTWNPGSLIMNVTDGSEGILTAMTATTATCTLSGGTDNDWDIGDEYRIYRTVLATIRPCDGTSEWDGNSSAGYPCRDQIGAGPDDPVWTHSPAGEWSQSWNKAYVWNNVKSDGTTPWGVEVAHGDDAYIQSGREYETTVPSGYVPLSGPHPYTELTGTCDPSKYGVEGYNVGTRTITFTGSRTATSTTGGSRTIVLKH